MKTIATNNIQPKIGMIKGLELYTHFGNNSTWIQHLLRMRAATCFVRSHEGGPGSCSLFLAPLLTPSDSKNVHIASFSLSCNSHLMKI